MKKYWINPKISWKNYKYLYEKTGTKDSGPIPKEFDRMLWELLRDRKLNIYITDKEVEGDTWFPTLKNIPKNGKIIK